MRCGHRIQTLTPCTPPHSHNTTTTPPPPLLRPSLPQEPPTSGTWATAFNAVNVLCGVGLLTVPYALEESGWVALLVLLVVGELGVRGRAAGGDGGLVHRRSVLEALCFTPDTQTMAQQPPPPHTQHC